MGVSAACKTLAIVHSFYRPDKVNRSTYLFHVQINCSFLNPRNSGELYMSYVTNSLGYQLNIKDAVLMIHWTIWHLFIKSKKKKKKTALHEKLNPAL